MNSIGIVAILNQFLGNFLRFNFSTTKNNSENIGIEINDTLQPGHITLPNGLGVDYPGDDGALVKTGVAPNELTVAEDRDWVAGTPWHKHVRARVEAIPSS